MHTTGTAETQSPLLYYPNSEKLSWKALGAWRWAEGLPCGACHPPGGCKCRWRLSAPGRDKGLSQAERGLSRPARGPPHTLPAPPGAVLLTLGPPPSLSPFQGLRIAASMKLVPVALLYLGSLAFLGADTARLDVASEFRKK